MANITLARMTYDRLVGLAEATPYNQGVILKLKAFDYDGFMTQNGLNAVVFSKLRDYLEKGDITGTLKHTRDNLAALEAQLSSVVQKLSLHQLPELTMTWTLNETCAYTSLFGSYAARVFQSLD